jgi:tetratricopeptide (TPR) repeat protein
VKIWEWFDFIPAGLADEATQILALADDEIRVAEAEAFILLYEERLLQHPFCAMLEEAFRALVMLYNYRGQWYEERAEYARAVDWLERAAFIIHQSEVYRTGLFIHTFLQLSFCSMELSAFEPARLYIDTYALYDPSAHEECEQIRSSIRNIQTLYNDAMEAYTSTLPGGTPQQYEQAIFITLQALRYAPNDAVLHFNLACFYSVLRDLPKSLYYLDLAFQKGFQNAAKLFNDHDLENIRTTKEFTDMFIHYFRPDAKES